MSKPIMIRLQDDLSEWLDALCKRTGLKRTAAIHKALEDYRTKTDAQFKILEAAHKRQARR